MFKPFKRQQVRRTPPDPSAGSFGAAGVLRARRQLVSLVTGALLTLGCGLSAPTLPLPPPSAEEPTVPVSGQSRLRGTVAADRPGVRILALNMRTDFVYGQELQTGRFDFLVGAESGDVLILWYTANGVDSEAVQLEVPFPDSSAQGQSDAGADAGSR